MRHGVLFAQVSLLPPIAAIGISVTAGPLADGLIERGWPVARVRKLAQSAAFLCPTACLLAAANCDDGPTSVGPPCARPVMWTVYVSASCHTLVQVRVFPKGHSAGISGFSLGANAPLYCRHSTHDDDVLIFYAQGFIGFKTVD